MGKYNSKGHKGIEEEHTRVPSMNKREVSSLNTQNVQLPVVGMAMNLPKITNTDVKTKKKT